MLNVFEINIKDIRAKVNVNKKHNRISLLGFKTSISSLLTLNKLIWLIHHLLLGCWGIFQKEELNLIMVLQ